MTPTALLQPDSNTLENTSFGFPEMIQTASTALVADFLTGTIRCDLLGLDHDYERI